MGQVGANKKIGVPLEGLAELSRKAAAQGAVLLRNEDQVLPLAASDKLAVFGRCQIEYYRSGTGSGGAVNVPYTVSLLEGLRNQQMNVDEELAKVYENWIKAHPFDNGGGGWACEPWCQQEMPLQAQLVEQAAQTSDKAIVVIGRTAGEDKDNAAKEGSYFLTQKEKDMLAQVCAGFEQVIVVLNVGNIIDMSFLETTPHKEHIKAVLYAWHGGMEGGNAAVDVLTGKVTAQGRLTDTIACDLKAYPSDANHGGSQRNLYQEDVYVGYRYFETFDKAAVVYPFGYGLSYTQFDYAMQECHMEGIGADARLRVVCDVTNCGNQYEGRTVMQLYVQGPQGSLGRPARELAAFIKTKVLACKESQRIIFTVPLRELAVFDDSGASGHANAYVLEEGSYRFYLGENVRDARLILVDSKEAYKIEQTILVEQCQEASAPQIPFERLRPGAAQADGQFQKSYEAVPTRKTNIKERIEERLPKALAITGNKGFHLSDVAKGSCSMEEFIAQLSEQDLAAIVRGEGMCSNKGTPGTAAVFGGVTDHLLSYGIPIGCCADGPSGIRMDNGLLATQLPIGTLLACTWDTQLVEEVFTMQGKELVRNEIDTLLGPGINLHRHPLNGRNFEYFSEDPLLTGKMAAAVVRGIAKNGVHATVKHFACNSQETGRHVVDAVVSQRALRQIYLKGFELAVKEGNAQSIMTSYNPMNGYWTASHYDLNTTILRGEWGYQGILMTDWWAQMNDVVEGGQPSRKKIADMVRSQNDVYMVVNNNGAAINAAGDDTIDALRKGRLTIGELQRSAENLCRFLMNTPAMERIDSISNAPLKIKPAAAPEGSQVWQISEESKILLTQETRRWFHVEQAGIYEVIAKLMSPESDRAQTVCKALLNQEELNTFQTNGTQGRWMQQLLVRAELEQGDYLLELTFPKPGMVVEFLEFRRETES